MTDERVLRTFVYARHLIKGDRIYVAKSLTSVKQVTVEGNHVKLIGRY